MPYLSFPPNWPVSYKGIQIVVFEMLSYLDIYPQGQISPVVRILCNSYGIERLDQHEVSRVQLER